MKLKNVIKVLGISGSSKLIEEEKSNSDDLLIQLMDVVSQYGGATEILRLGKMNIPRYIRAHDKKNVQDFLQGKRDSIIFKIYESVIDADALVVASPVEWGDESYLIRLFLTHLTALESYRYQIAEKLGKDPIEGKPMVILVSEESDGASSLFGQLAWRLIQMGFFILPYGCVYKHSILNKRIVRLGLHLVKDGSKFGWIDNTIRLHGRNLVLFTDLIKDYKFDDDLYEEPED